MIYWYVCLWNNLVCWFAPASDWSRNKNVSPIELFATRMNTIITYFLIASHCCCDENRIMWITVQTLRLNYHPCCGGASPGTVLITGESKNCSQEPPLNVISRSQSARCTQDSVSLWHTVTHTHTHFVSDRVCVPAVTAVTTPRFHPSRPPFCFQAIVRFLSISGHPAAGTSLFGNCWVDWTFLHGYRERKKEISSSEKLSGASTQTETRIGQFTPPEDVSHSCLGGCLWRVSARWDSSVAKLLH